MIMNVGIEVLGVLGGLVIGGLLGLLTPLPKKDPANEPKPVPVPIPVEEERASKRRSK